MHVNRLKEELCTLFKVYKEACSLYEKEIVETPPDARLRGFWSKADEYKIGTMCTKYFPFNWKIGKHGRFMLRINGYIILFKKLNRKNMPMHIDSSISSYRKSNARYLVCKKRWLYRTNFIFGYQKDKFGELQSPKLVYIDEFKFKWEITSADIAVRQQVENSDTFTMPNNNSMSIKQNALDRKELLMNKFNNNPIIWM